MKEVAGDWRRLHKGGTW